MAINTHLCLKLVVVCMSVIAFATCGKDSPTKPKPPEPPPPPVSPVATRIEITPPSATLNSIGQTVRLTARVFDQNNNAMASATVTWSSSDVSVAGVNAPGLVTAVKSGTVVITARSGSANATVNITVSQTAGSIVIAPEMATLMSLSETVQLEATVLDGNGQPVAGPVVTWESSDEAVATVSTQGLVTAVNNGAVRITATSGSASAGIDVTVMQSAGSIVIEPMEATLMSLGASVQLSVTVLDGNGQPVSGTVVTWQSSDDAVATVSAQGLVTAVRNGTVRITARSGTASAGIDVSVMQSAGSIMIAPEEATLMSIGETVQLTATVLDGNGQPVVGAVVDWQSSDEAVATVSAQGLVTAVTNGVARITATSGSASSGVDVTVMQSAGSIVIEPMEATLMSLGETVQLESTVLDGNGQPVAGAVVIWQSSDEAVATVSTDGLVTAVMNGTARIMATSGTATAGIDVTVMQSAGSIVIEPEEATLMAIGETVQLTATVLDGNGQSVAGAVVMWQSGDDAVARVSAQGLVTAVANGVAHVTATSGSATSGIDVTVMQSAGSIVIAPEMATLMSLGETVQLTATVLDGNGQPVAGAVVTWQSNDDAVATVSAQGLVTAVANGTARIMATSGTATAGIDVTVMQSAGSIVIEPEEATLMAIGETVQLTATVLDGNGQPVAGAVVTWQSSDESVATVSAQGLVTAVRNGVTRIWATSGSAMTSISLKIIQTAGSIVIEPLEATLISLGETVQLSAKVLDGNGQPVEGAVVDWQSSDEAVATVSAQGLVTAVKNGVARITATSGSASSGVDVTVMQSAGSIVIAPMEATLMSIGATVQLEATVLDGNGQPVEGAVVTWHSSEESVATVSAQGLVMAVRNGVTRIWATSGSAMSSIAAKVMQSAGSIVIEPMEATLMSLGATVQLTATVLDGNGQPIEGAVVTWQSSDESVATVSADGLVTAVRNGTTRITATSVSATAGIDVTVMQSAGSIVIEPDIATLMSLGATVQLESTVLDGNGQPVAGAVVTWQSSDDAVATVSAQGLVTAVGNGVSRITATSGSALAGIDVTVMQTAGSIVIAPEMATLMSLGETVQLESTVLDGNSQPIDGAVVTWQSSDEAVATVNAQGLVTAVKNGVARITTTSGGATAGIDITVMQSAGSIVIAPMEATLMSIGATVQLEATVLDANRQPVEDAVVTWQSGDEAIATVSAQGLVTSVKNGVARITARSGSASESVDVSVMQSAGSIVIEPRMTTIMSIGETVQLMATVLDGNGQPVAGTAVRWSSGDELVATVNADGLVTAVGNGVVRITATSGSASAGIDVTVMQSAGSLMIAPEMATLMSLGETVQLTATVLDGNGQPVAGAVVIWQSGDEAVATVDAQGLVTAVSNGIARITAISGSASAGVDVTVRIPSPDRDVLVALYNSMDGPNWKNNTYWLSEDRHVDDWYGVNTDEEGRVTDLNLGNNGLKGQLPIELVQLISLEGLSLEGNLLTGPIPPALGQLENLTHLYLFDNLLTGSIPAELGKLINLIHLCLNGNQLMGSIPRELGQLASLKWLHLHWNPDLSGALPATMTGLNLDALLLLGTQVCLPDDPEIEKWLNSIPETSVGDCTGFDLERNVLVEIYTLTDGANWKNNTNWLTDAPLGDWNGVDTDASGRITQLNLANNGLSGPFPSQLAKLTNLSILNLGINKLVGVFPREIGQLTNLASFDVNSNLLADQIPSQLGQLTRLVNLNLAGNRLNGPIPPQLGKLTNLEVLNLNGNNLSGTIPSELGQLINLRELHLISNEFSGSIPTELGQLINLKSLFLALNKFSGFIPTELGNLGNLEGLQLGNNKLTGSIPSELGQLENLTVLDFRSNNLTGGIPAALGNLKSATFLYLNSNELSGSMPSELGQLNNLHFMFLHQNRLSGSIPAEFGQLSKLNTMALSENQLSGPVPSELGELGNLRKMYLYDNILLAGPLPTEFAKLISLELLNLSNTQLCASFDTEIQAWLMSVRIKFGIVDCVDAVTRELNVLTKLFEGTDGPNWRNNDNWLSNKSVNQWFGITTNAKGRVTRVELENNSLNGTLPGELGRLAELKALNFEANSSLSGKLPRELTNLSLETLQIGGTQLCVPEDDEFHAWLMTVSPSSDVYNCEESVVLADRSVLAELYHATDGPNWKNNSNWLSDEPMGTWYGVETDAEGRVTNLILRNNQLTGSLPLELGRLKRLEILEVDRNHLTGDIPPELGQLAKLTSLSFENNQLSGVIPPDLGYLESIRRLVLSRNQLTGGIPPELGDLSNLSFLHLAGNQLSGNIPSELGDLSNLSFLHLTGNQLSGNIPSELGDLTTLEILSLDGNQLRDGIPSELGQLKNLTLLRLDNNRLSGQIPSELGGMSQLTFLELSFNELSGGIPVELGQLASLTYLGIARNLLSGTIPIELGRLSNLTTLFIWGNKLSGNLPPELGNLGNLKYLDIQSNQLTGELPPELGNLTKLSTLRIGGNTGFTGPIPMSLTNLSLDHFHFRGTHLCIPSDPSLTIWLGGIEDLQSSFLDCQTPNTISLNPRVFLTQAVQSFDRPVPLLEGESALLRVFFTSDEVILNRPAVRATFYLDGTMEHTVEIPAGPAKIPVQIAEGSRETSANAVIPGNIIVPGLELVVEITPAGALDPESGIAIRVPEYGRIDVDVRKVPEFNLTLVPLLWTEHPNHAVVTQTAALTDEDDLFRLTRDLLPVNDFQLKVDEPVWTSHDPGTFNSEILNELQVIRAMIGGTGYYMGVVGQANEGVLTRGVAKDGGFSSMSILDGRVIAHELGHNLSLGHAPCGLVFDADPSYPYAGGSIGAWGYDSAFDKLLDPAITVDVMGYCRSNVWISDYYFNQAFFFRIRQEESLLATASSPRAASLLLWGGLDAAGELVLEPSFVVNAPVSLPREDGPYQLVGEDTAGNTLFTLSFSMSKVADGEGGGFAFTVPVRSEWSGRLSRITLSGPDGFVEMTRDSDQSAALLLDQSTGKVRGILRDWPEPGTTVGAARRVVPEPGLEVVISSGIPNATDWER